MREVKIKMADYLKKMNNEFPEDNQKVITIPAVECLFQECNYCEKLVEFEESAEVSQFSSKRTSCL